jgi:hypothetical protein
VTSGDAFTAGGTQGTSLYFYDAQGRGQLTLADLSGVQTWTLPNVTGTIVTTGDTGSVNSTMLLDSTVAEADLSVTNSAVAGYILSYDSGGGFTWIANSGGSGASKWTLGADFAYLTQTSYDLVLGASAVTDAPFFFDVSAGTISFEGGSADAFETVLGIENPDGDQTLNLPNIAGASAVIATIDGAQTFTSAVRIRSRI